MGMPLYANLSPDPPHPNLDVLVRNLDVDTVRCKRLMRHFLEEDEDGFVREAVGVLQKQVDTRGARHMLGLLADRGLLIRVLCAPGISKEHALELAQAAISVAPSTDILLARGLADMLESSDGPEQLTRITRLMGILAAISDTARVFPSIVRLLRHPNPHVRSKAVLMIGRRNRSAQWVRHRLDDSDPRIRANALETLWNVDTAEARQLLEGLVHDPNNRVAGNALLGLYRLGVSSSIPEILNLAGHESALFRSTAAWVMGETGDPRFTEVLAGLLREPHASVRKRAFAALAQIRTVVAKAMQSPPCRLAARLPEAPRGAGRVLLAVGGANAYAAPDLLATHIVLSEDGRPVPCYRVVERALPETISVVFLLPAHGRLEPWRRAALSCLPWKRSCDLWACDYYEPEAALEAGADNGLLNFQASSENIHAEFGRQPLRFECPDLWRGIHRLVDVEAGPMLGKRQLIVFREGETRGAPGDDLVAAIAASKAMLQVISRGPDPILEDFCRRVNGVFSCIETLEDAPDAAIDAYLRQVPRYEITWQPVSPDARQLKIRLHGPSISGETTVRLFAAGAMIEV